MKSQVQLSDLVAAYLFASVIAVPIRTPPPNPLMNLPNRQFTTAPAPEPAPAPLTRHPNALIEPLRRLNSMPSDERLIVYHPTPQAAAAERLGGYGPSLSSASSNSASLGPNRSNTMPDSRSTQGSVGSGLSNADSTGANVGSETSDIRSNQATDGSPASSNALLGQAPPPSGVGETINLVPGRPAPRPPSPAPKTPSPPPRMGERFSDKMDKILSPAKNYFKKKTGGG